MFWHYQADLASQLYDANCLSFFNVLVFPDKTFNPFGNEACYLNDLHPAVPCAYENLILLILKGRRHVLCADNCIQKFPFPVFDAYDPAITRRSLVVHIQRRHDNSDHPSIICCVCCERPYPAEQPFLYLQAISINFNDPCYPSVCRGDYHVVLWDCPLWISKKP